VLEDPYILIHEKKISNMKDLLPLLEQIARAASRSSSLPRKWMAKRWPLSWSTSCVARLNAAP
jgi:hypothetical protein